MKKDASTEEKKLRAAQTAAHKAADWIKVYIDGRKARMMKRSDYGILQAAKELRG